MKDFAAAVVAADPNLAHRFGGARSCHGTLRRTVGAGGEIAEHLLDHLRRQAAVRRLVELGDRSERSATQTGHALDRETPLRVGVLSGS